ncbi:MAG: hypothetical protein ACREFX_07420, partial [Opitutaceae bacterium]
ARRSRDVQNYQLHLKSFDTNMRAAIAQNAQDQSAYRSALTRAQYGSEDTFHKLQLAATARHDSIMASLAQQRNGIEIDRLNTMRAEAGARLQIAAETVKLNAEKIQFSEVSTALENGFPVPLDVLKRFGLAAPDAAPANPHAQPAGPTRTKDGDLKSGIDGVPSLASVLNDPTKYGGLAPDFLRSAWLVANYREKPQVVLSTMGSRPGFRTRFMGVVSEINPRYNFQNVGMQEGARKNWTEGAGATAIRSFSTAIYHLASLQGFAQALGNTDVVPVNSFTNFVARLTGNSNVTNFDTAKTVVTSEVMNALQGHGSVAMDERLERQFSTANSPAQLMGAIRTAANLLEGRLHVIRQLITGQTGEASLSDQLIPQAAVSLLSQLNGAPASGAAPMPPAIASDIRSAGVAPGSDLWNFLVGNYGLAAVKGAAGQ